MSISTDGQLCYGYVFPENYEFPWDAELFDDDGEIRPLDEEDWWIVETGYRYDGEYPYTDGGEYAPGFSYDDPRTQAYIQSRLDWKKSHPLPFELVNYQSDECPAFILAIKSSIHTANRGYPVVINADTLHPPTQEDIEALARFIKEYELEPESGPAWYLSSYWG